MEAKQTGLHLQACLQGCSNVYCLQKEGKGTDFKATIMQLS